MLESILIEVIKKCHKIKVNKVNYHKSQIQIFGKNQTQFDSRNYINTQAKTWIRWHNQWKITKDQWEWLVKITNLLSEWYLGGILVGCLIMKGVADSSAESHIFGENGKILNRIKNIISKGNGGSILKMKSINSNYDYYYNREFQRMRWLTEQPSGTDSTTLTSE